MSLASSRLRSGLGASTSYAKACPLLVKPRSIVCASSGRRGPSTSGSFDFDEATRSAKSQWDSFAKEQELEKKANQAMKKGGEVFEQAKNKARRVFVRLDSEYDISSKTAKAAKKAEEAARDLDQQYGVRRRFRAAREDLARNWPAWQKQLDEFTATTPGKITVFAGLCLLISTPIFWQLLNVVLLLWWLTVPLSLLVLNAAANQQAEQMRQQQQAAAEAEARRRANPFADMFRDAGAAFSGATAGRSGGGGAAGGAGRGSGYVQQDGPVIEAEWTSLDDEGNPRSKGGRR